jgi:hypothetical protein
MQRPGYGVWRKALVVRVSVRCGEEVCVRCGGKYEALRRGGYYLCGVECEMSRRGVCSM